MYPRNLQNQSYTVLINSFKQMIEIKRSINLFMFVLSYLGFIATDWIKTTARIETLIN